MNIKANKSFIYCCVLIAFTFIISIRPMILSTYASVSSDSIVYYLCAFLPIAVLFVITARFFETAFSSMCCTLATLLTLGNASAMPLLRYTSAYDVDNVLAYSRSLCMNSLITVGLVPVVWGSVWLCNCLNNEKRNRKWLCIGYDAISGILAVLLLFFVDEESGTTLIQLPGLRVQTALPVMVLSIIGFSLSWHMDNKTMRVAVLAAIALINTLLFVRGETGIPIITLLAFSLWYYLLQPTRYRFISVTIPVVAGIGIITILLLHSLAPFLPESGLLHTLSGKIEGRIFSDSVDQVEKALRSIRTGGFWGSNGYNINVPEASSDSCLSTIIHYSGLIFLLLMLASAVPMFYSGVKHYTEHKHTLYSDLGSISLSIMFIMIFYNMLMCSGHLPVLGSQIPFTGVSMTYAILSAFLLGAITYSQDITSNLVKKLKGGLAYAQCYPDPNYVADPRKGLTSHSRGNTIDIGLVHMDGSSVVLPSAFDEFSEKADRDYSDVSITAALNAKLLEETMYANGFTGYYGEWWDYSDTKTYTLLVPW